MPKRKAYSDCNIHHILKRRETNEEYKLTDFFKLIAPVINKDKNIIFKYFLNIDDYKNDNIQDKIKDKTIYYLTFNEETNNKLVLIQITEIDKLNNIEDDSYEKIEMPVDEFYFMNEQNMPVKSKYVLNFSCGKIDVSDIDLLNSLYTDSKNYYYIPADIILNEENIKKFIELLKLSSLNSIEYIFTHLETRREYEIREDEEALRRNLEEIAEFRGGKNNKNKEKTRVIYTDIDNKGKKYKYINYKKERYIITNKDIKKQYIIINKIRINIINKQK